MALYTYADFENEAKRLGQFDSLAKADINLAKSNPDAGMSLLKYLYDYSQETNTSKQRTLENSINSLRSTYGGYKITNGQLQLTTPTATNFNYVSPYADRIGELTDAIANRQPFSYDPKTDPAAQAAKKGYLRDSKRATEDAVASAAAMTGGIPSSYAVMAGTQAGDYHASQFADRVQALEDAAYNKYINEHSIKQNELNNLLERDANEKNAAYAKHMNRVNGGDTAVTYTNYNSSLSYGGSTSKNTSGGSSISSILPTPEAAAVPETPTVPDETPTENVTPDNSAVGGNNISSALPTPSDTPISSQDGTTGGTVTTPNAPTAVKVTAANAGEIYSALNEADAAVLSRVQFDKMKNMGNIQGQMVPYETTKYSTYEEYLQSYLDRAFL